MQVFKYSLLAIIIVFSFILFNPFLGMLISLAAALFGGVIPISREFQQACEEFHRQYHGWDPSDFDPR